MYNLLQPFFMERLSSQVGSALEAKIAERWQFLIGNPTPRLAVVEIKNPGLMQDGTLLNIEKIVFGVVTFFHVGSPKSHVALPEHVLSDVVIKKMQTNLGLRLVFDADAKPVSIDFGGGKIVRGPFSTTPQSYFFPKTETDPAGGDPSD